MDKYDLEYLYNQIHEVVKTQKDSKRAVVTTRPLLSEILSSEQLQDKFLRPIQERPAAYLVHRPPDKSFSVISMVWNAEQKFPIHDHLSWGLIGVYSNAIVEQRFNRLDDGTRKGYAEIVEESTRDYFEGQILEEGLEYDDIHKNDIHRILNNSAKHSVSIHIIASDLGMRQRNQYDPVAKTVRKFISGYDDPDHAEQGRLITGRDASQVIRLEPGEILDTMGDRCPVPANKTHHEVEHLAAGKVLQILTDSERSAYDEIPEVLNNEEKLCYAVLEQHEGFWKIKVMKRAK